MALTKADVSRNNEFGNRWVDVVQYTGDNSYPTGGWSAPATDFGQHTIRGWVTLQLLATSTGVATVKYNLTTSKIQAFTTAGVETTNATDCSTLVVLATAYS